MLSPSIRTTGSCAAEDAEVCPIPSPLSDRGIILLIDRTFLAPLGAVVEEETPWIEEDLGDGADAAAAAAALAMEDHGDPTPRPMVKGAMDRKVFTHLHKTR